MIASIRRQVAPVDGGLGILGHAAHPGQHPHDLAERAHLLDLLELLEEVLEGEAPLAQLLLHLGRLLLVERLLGPLDEREHVAHAQDPAGQPVGMEQLERVGLLAGAEELDRQAGHGADGQRGAAAGVAVDLGQDEPGQRHGAVERLGDRDRLLAGHRVDHEERLSTGWIAAATSAISAISASSTVSRPAVSTMTVSRTSRRAASMPPRAMSTTEVPSGAR